MYEIRPETILTFLTDRNVRFPRFQRKQTWTDEQNMKLAISIFKTYPVGVTIINKEEYDGKSYRWLLDWRQRRNALKLMLEDPENIYMWSRKFLWIKWSDQSQDIEEKFWKKIDEYLNYNEEEGESSNDVDENEEIPAEAQNDEEIRENNKNDLVLVDQNYNRKYLGNLNELLFIIKAIHNKTPKYSGFSKPFDLTNIIDNLPYVDKENGRYIFSGKKLTTFINQYNKFIADEEKENNVTNFKLFLTKTYKLNKWQEASLDKTLEQNWEYINKSFRVVDLIENRLSEAKIGIIETKNINSTDSQMIFKLINDEGTKLTAVEILSAKPSWNIKVQTPSTTLQAFTKDLYNEINTENEEVVRWDYPATLYERLTGQSGSLHFIFPKLDYKNHNLDKKVTLWFKLLSGIYQGGIKKEDISELASNKSIDWSKDVDEVVKDLQDIGRILGDHSYFKYLKSWNTSLLEITSDAITLNFCFTMYADFKRKNKPIWNNRITKQFINNAVILIDKLIFEYVTKKWRGSSDSKISQNIKWFEALPDQFERIWDKEWLNLIKSINDDFRIEDDEIKFGLMKSIIYHIYSIHECMGPDNVAIPVNVDHIIPQALFDWSTLSKKMFIKDALFNLCLLPQKENIKKSDKKLIEISDKWLKDQIEKYSSIKEEEYNQFSTVLNWEQLRERRRSFFEKDFIEKRLDLLNR